MRKAPTIAIRIICAFALLILVFFLGTPNKTKLTQDEPLDQLVLSDKLLPCFADFNNDGVSNSLFAEELKLVINSSDCLSLNGAIGLPGSRVRDYTRKEKRKILKDLRKKRKEKIKVEKGITLRRELLPNRSVKSKSSENGRLDGTPTSTQIPENIAEEILDKVSPALKDKQFDERDFDCEDFSEVADEAMPELKYIVTSCKLVCHKWRESDGYSSGVGLAEWLGLKKKIGGFAHAVVAYQDNQDSGKLYPFEPQDLNGNEPKVTPVNLDLDGDGKISKIEVTEDVLGFDLFDLIVNRGNVDEFRRCDKLVLSCKNWRFNDRGKAFRFFRRNFLAGVRASRARNPR